MTFELRRYEVKEGCLDAFARVWREQLLPLRQSFGFTVLGPWIITESNEFVWIVGHDDFDAATEAYYGSPQRGEVNPRPGELLERVSSWPMVGLHEWLPH